MLLLDKDFDTIPAQFIANSPSGGPTGNPNAIVLISMRTSRKLKWKTADGTVRTVDLIMPSITDDTATGGPTPYGEYLIGQRYTHATHNIDWYKLYPRMKNNQGYFGYTAATETGRSAMGLHPGTVSLGCATVDIGSSRPYDTNSNWIALRTYVNGGAFTYRGSGYSGFLYVVDK
jgi:hypothetical protein